MVSSNLLR